MKIYLTAIIKAKEQYRDEVLTALQHMVTQTHKEPACELYTLHQGIDDQNVFIFYEIWRDQEGLDAHDEQPYIKDFGTLINEKLQETPIIIKTTLR